MMQLKITSDLRKLEAKFKGVMKNAFSQTNMTNYAMFLAEAIKKRTRLGYGVPEDEADKERLRPLSKPYILYRKVVTSYNQRKSKAKNPSKTKFSLTKKQMSGASTNDLKGLNFFQRNAGTDKQINKEYTSYEKSNLTFTGQLLNALFGRGTGVGKAEVFLKEKRDDGIKNSDIVKWQENQDRPFFHISKIEKSQLKSAARKDLLEYIKKNF